MSTSASALKIPGWMWWLGAVALLLYFVSAVSSILFPFVVGLAIAYLLDPLTDRLEALHIPRALAALMVLLVFFGVIVGIILLIAPILGEQLAGIAHALPHYAAEVRPFLLRLLRRAGSAAQAKDLMAQASSRIVEFLSARGGELLSEGLAIFNTLTLMLVSPVVAYYMLRDWDKMVATLDQWLPRRAAPTIRQLLRECDAALSGFVRGQTLVCIALGFMYAIGWSLVGLQYGLLLGLIVGLLGFVPTAGPTFGVIVALIIAIGQWGTGELNHIGLVFLVFVVAQAIEQVYLTPKLIGEKVGLHPVWVLFAIFVGGALLGLVGVFIAVPSAAVIAVLARYGLQRYLASSAFRED